MSNLKCPFCGSMERDFSEHKQSCFLYMLEEQIGSNGRKYSEEAMEKAWNTRANPWIEITEDNLPDQIGHYLAKEGSTVYFAFYNSDGKWFWENSFIEPTKYTPIPGDNQC